MWPTIPSFRPFGDVACPAGNSCEIPYCIFSHEAIKKPAFEQNRAPNLSTFEDGREPKRVKLDDGTKKQNLPTSSSPARTPQPVFVGSIASKASSTEAKKDASKSKQLPATASDGKTALPRSATRPVSPPPKSAKAKVEPKSDPPVALWPRKLAKEPATFTKRQTLLKTLRTYMAAHNDKVSRNPDAGIKALALSEYQLNKLAVDEEAQVGLQNKTVYENVLKQRLVALKKMTTEAWIKERKEAVRKESGGKAGEKQPPAQPKPVETGLSPKEEVIILTELITPQSGLDNFGYVTKLPSKAELDEQSEALVAADHWEVCDRCSTRFQVFPERREEDGALTTGGKCRHHWGKKMFPKRSKGAPPEPTKYTCCGEPLGSPGCSVYDTHVFKVSGAKRLSTVMPFIETPENDKVEPHTAVCFDCEMGYTTQGLELLRLTAVSWPTHKQLLDILVRPLGQILDVNTRFSGVSPEQYFNAAEYDPNNPTSDTKDLRIVDSPYIARDLFLSHVSPSTPLVGHALENDLNSIRLIHPTLVDTVFLFPHPAGLPIRNGLRALAKLHLNLDIQQAGAAGHDSFEDARATGELVRLKVAERWKKLKREGWTIREDGLYPPVPIEVAPPVFLDPLPPSMPGGKRTFGQYGEGEESDGDEITAKRQQTQKQDGLDVEFLES